ncbi:MAG: hypothetical protein HY672_04655 [Chloroflexi bacterium]|nr:hypothetical protein [Chloroflexota bacterium]
MARTAAILILMGLTWLVAGLLASHFTHMRDLRRKYEQRLEIQLEETRLSRRRLVHVQEELRKSVAQRLHGRVQNRLLVAAHWLREATKDTSVTSANDVQEKLGRALASLEEVIDRDLRTVVRQLHPSVIQLGLMASLQSLLDRFQGALDISLSVDESVAELDNQNPRAIPEETRLALFRVVEEALNNVVKHAEASQVQLKIGCPTPEVISVEVQDNGKGLDPSEAVPGLGIISMRDYCGALGGQLQIESRSGVGTVVRASLALPLSEQRPNVMEHRGAGEVFPMGVTRAPASLEHLSPRSPEISNIA